ncbi:MAG: hypothetical protein K2M48_05915 [Clostridiales bacterium]|nr:hypothetical protein [Clostridiales bacterium]
MKNGMARALAIIALVFMGIFIVSLTMTVIDYTMLNSSIGYIALSSGVFVLMIFLALKADGRTFSITKMNNEIEMEKIEKELAEKEKAEKEKAEAQEEKAEEVQEESETAEATDGNPTETDTAEQQESEKNAKE